MTLRLTLSTICFLVCAVSLADESPRPAGADKARSANSPRSFSQSSPTTEWEIVFPDEITVEEYARQIDFFKIEIAAVSKNGKIEYLSQASGRKPEKRVGDRSADYRLHIGWKRGALQAADRKLLAKAGIGSQNKELWHFIPAPTQALMTDLERAYAGGETGEIRRTRFEVRPKAKGGGYDFVVVEQDPPRPADAEPTVSTALDSPTPK